MVLKLHNTLSGRLEDFVPLKPEAVRLYSCGPTVYDRAHIGNLRSYIFSDLLRRTLELNGYAVRQIINITDVGHLVADGDAGEDKMMHALRRANKPLTLEAMREVAEQYAALFQADLKELNVKLPEQFPRASDHIAEDIELVKILLEKGVAYRLDDGIYFEVSEFSRYDEIFGLKTNSEVEAEFARVTSAAGKRNHRDFALWKFSKPNEVGFESELGRGFPGWHIECSAMARKYLDQPFDLHTGGMDHIPVHHKNEIAQSEAAYGVPLATYWLHNAFVQIDGGKMAKSLNNFYTLADLHAHHISPLAYRLWLLMGHYRSPLNFTWEAALGSQTALDRLMDKFVALGEPVGEVNENYRERFLAQLNGDLNSPAALALMSELWSDEKVTAADKKATFLYFDQGLGLGMADWQPLKIPAAVQALLEKREAARAAKDWPAADQLRAEIETQGFTIDDTETGAKLRGRA